MPADRYFVNQPFALNETVSIEGEEFHHLSRVMRKKEKEPLELINGQGSFAKGVLLSLNKKGADVEITHIETIDPLLPPIILIQAIPKLSHLEWILQKGTELGVTEFWLFPSLLSEKKEFSANQSKRLHQITINAMKQCGRFDLPKIVLKPSLQEIQIEKGTPFFGDLNPKAPILEKQNGSGPFFFFIGPEKGFTDQEIEQIKKQHKAQGIKLHPYTLRAETAAIAAISLLSFSILAIDI